MFKNIICWFRNNPFWFSLGLITLTWFVGINIGKRKIDPSYGIIIILLIGISIRFYWYVYKNNFYKEISHSVNAFITIMFIFCGSGAFFFLFTQTIIIYGYYNAALFIIIFIPISMFLSLFFSLLMLDSSNFRKILESLE